MIAVVVIAIFLFKKSNKIEQPILVQPPIMQPAPQTPPVEDDLPDQTQPDQDVAPPEDDEDNCRPLRRPNFPPQSDS